MEWIEWEGLDGMDRMGIEQGYLDGMDRRGRVRWNRKEVN